MLADVGGDDRVAQTVRESVQRGLARADGLVLLSERRYAGGADRLEVRRELPVFSASLAPIAGERLAGARLLAFAGIGRPEKFFASLRSLGAELVGARAFPDHYPFRDTQIAELRRDAEQARARLITTAKDIVRVPAASRAGIEVLEVEIRWDDPGAVCEFFRPVVQSAASDGANSVDRRD